MVPHHADGGQTSSTLIRLAYWIHLMMASQTIQM